MILQPANSPLADRTMEVHIANVGCEYISRLLEYISLLYLLDCQHWRPDEGRL